MATVKYPRKDAGIRNAIPLLAVLASFAAKVLEKIILCQTATVPKTAIALLIACMGVMVPNGVK